jgi:putative phosphoesterase
MKICVISDTHARRIDDLPPALITIMKEADAIIHLGDFDKIELVHELKQLGNFYGVTGNHDFARIRAELPETDILEIDGRKLGLVHGNGSPKRNGLERELKARFKEEKLDAILYGHTHITRNEAVDGTLFFNPGSAAGRFPAYRKSYGILHVNGTIESEVIPLISHHKKGTLWHKYPRLLSYLQAPRKAIYLAASVL